MENVIVYEQPLNELIRVSLRLEKLFNDLDHLMPDTSIIGTHNIIVVIMNILHLLDRPDLKAKYAKELSNQVTILQRLKNTPDMVDTDKLNHILKQLNSLARSFIDTSGKIGQSLREIELLNNLRLHLATPGGGCSFDIPVYHYWLNRPPEERQQTLRSWIEEFSNIRLTVTLLLQLIREESKVHEKRAENGFYQELLDPQTNLKLIRVEIPSHTETYPEISVGRHFLSIRFYNPRIVDRPTQFASDISFWLSYCTS